MEGAMGNLEEENIILKRNLFLDLHGWYILAKKASLRRKGIF
jgi:hypothetical protein